MDHYAEALKLVDRLTELHLHISTAESCTGGLICASLVSIPGVSAVLDEAHVTYANEAKIKYLGVSEKTLSEKGAVSSECAEEMAKGLLRASGCDMAVVSTGLAGPGGETDRKPVGLVYIGTAVKDRLTVTENHFKGDRDAVRNAAVSKALEQAFEMLENGEN